MTVATFSLVCSGCSGGGGAQHTGRGCSAHLRLTAHSRWCAKYSTIVYSDDSHLHGLAVVKRPKELVVQLPKVSDVEPQHALLERGEASAVSIELVLAAQLGRTTSGADRWQIHCGIMYGGACGGSWEAYRQAVGGLVALEPKQIAFVVQHTVPTERWHPVVVLIHDFVRRDRCLARLTQTATGDQTIRRSDDQSDAQFTVNAQRPSGWQEEFRRARWVRTSSNLGAGTPAHSAHCFLASGELKCGV